VKQPFTEASAVADGAQSCQALPAATWQACGILQLVCLLGLWLAYYSKHCVQQFRRLLRFVTQYSFCSGVLAAGCTAYSLLRFLVVPGLHGSVQQRLHDQFNEHILRLGMVFDDGNCSSMTLALLVSLHVAALL
jgi:hypothetical protein